MPAKDTTSVYDFIEVATSMTVFGLNSFLLSFLLQGVDTIILRELFQ